ncbi:MAG: HD domain-containing protein [Lentimicrobiaceae bacterium]|nr:HD domain-containing protein [Lentimicrobiaceae bacterium]
MSKENQIVIEKTVEFVKLELYGAEGGHDWWHVYRVWKNSIAIGKTEDCNKLIVELSALLHDIADPKFYNGDENIGPQKAEEFLVSIGLSNEIIDRIIYIIRHVSFKNTFDNNTEKNNELNIVQDADRLDAIGAIGIARTFNYGGFKGDELYNPDIPPKNYKSKREYKSGNSPTLNHFYEKLLKLKGMMNTEAGIKIANNRHQFMEVFLKQFYSEWNGNS